MVTFYRGDGRGTVVAMLEDPIRRVMRGQDGVEPRAEIEAILEELDWMDEDTSARAHDARRRNELREEIALELVKPAGEGALCSMDTRTSYWSSSKDKRVHRAKVTINGRDYCLTHAKNAEERAVNAEFQQRESARQGAEQWTDDEVAMRKRREVVDARDHRQYR